MSTFALSVETPFAAVEPKAKPSLFRRLLEARERQALHRIQMFLAAQSDQRLQDLGYTAADIVAVRQGRLTMPAR